MRRPPFCPLRWRFSSLSRVQGVPAFSTKMLCVRDLHAYLESPRESLTQETQGWVGGKYYLCTHFSSFSHHMLASLSLGFSSWCGMLIPQHTRNRLYSSAECWSSRIVPLAATRPWLRAPAIQAPPASQPHDEPRQHSRDASHDEPPPRPRAAPPLHATPAAPVPCCLIHTTKPVQPGGGGHS